ncbi:hypothetical protein NPIL_362761 [Nephila pilipes]|uniref:Uncharacterized protein n=1 Tax=Nephila pilipes TaxID=299642 RepID=A0A8X6P1N5_NEPPI|nr:hypothetical protein NPIL_362761 [Nephila pilipes]
MLFFDNMFNQWSKTTILYLKNRKISPSTFSIDGASVFFSPLSRTLELIFSLDDSHTTTATFKKSTLFQSKQISRRNERLESRPPKYSNPFVLLSHDRSEAFGKSFPSLNASTLMLTKEQNHFTDLEGKKNSTELPSQIIRSNLTELCFHFRGSFGFSCRITSPVGRVLYR